MDEAQREIADLEARIEDLKRRLPRHSVPPVMIRELEELEEELERLRARSGRTNNQANLGR